jgi:hypothetical protein
MTSKGHKKSQYVKGIAILVVLAIFSYWGYYSYTYPTEWVSTISTTGPPLKWTDFNLTTTNGCTFQNRTIGQTEFAFVFYVTNRFNEAVHYLNESVTGFLISISGQKLRAVPFNVSRTSSDYTNRLVLILAFPTSIVPNGTFALSVSLTVYTQEVSGPILLLAQIPLAQAYSACSS